MDEASEAFESSKSKFEAAEQAYYDAEDKEVECEKKVNDCKKGNNGWGNGDQDAPGNSLEHNNAENAQDDNSAEISALESKIEQLTKEQSGSCKWQEKES